MSSCWLMISYVTPPFFMILPPDYHQILIYLPHHSAGSNRFCWSLQNGHLLLFRFLGWRDLLLWFLPERKVPLMSCYFSSKHLLKWNWIAIGQTPSWYQIIWWLRFAITWNWLDKTVIFRSELQILFYLTGIKKNEKQKKDCKGRKVEFHIGGWNKPHQKQFQ